MLLDAWILDVWMLDAWMLDAWMLDAQMMNIQTQITLKRTKRYPHEDVLSMEILNKKTWSKLPGPSSL